MTKQLHWTGTIDCESPTLGLPAVSDVQNTRLFTADPDSGTYSHHGYITTHDDRIVASWSNHACDEDAPGQRVLWSQSTDHGKSWSHWQELFPPHDQVKPGSDQDWHNDRILIANGFAVVADTLYAIAEVHVLEDRRGPGRIARAVSADGALGPIFWLVEDPPPPVSGFPAYPNASAAEFAETAKKITACLVRPEHLPSWEFRHHTSRPKAADGHQMCEPTQGWKLDDGTYVRLYRDLGEPCSNRNYAQYSFDVGQTWTTPVQTNFPDACSRSAAGTLPDGTAYVINNPGNTRDPLVISLAADGLNFDRHAVIGHGAPPRRHDGRWKDSGFEYPRAVVADNSLFVIYSICKEDMEVAEIPLSALKKMG